MLNSTAKAAKLDSPLGPILAIGDDQTLFYLNFDDGSEWKGYSIGWTRTLRSIEQELKEYFDGKQTGFETPFEMCGTPFQIRVWEELLKIPAGETRSYAEIAQSIGKPTAFRAVANANGANRLAIIIPCHRVINSNGQLGGYGGGIERKQSLLDLESTSNI